MCSKHQIALLAASWHCDSHKSICSTICCLTLLTASGELHFSALPEGKNQSFRRDNINYLQEKLMSMTVNAYYIGMSFKVATLDTFNG